MRATLRTLGVVRRCALACSALLLVVSSPLAAPAAIISGPTALLTQAYADQLESWLDEGTIEITRIYEKQAGHTSQNFHNAVDGKGRTFVLMEVLAGTYNMGSLNQADIDTQISTWPTTHFNSSGVATNATYYWGTSAIERQLIGGYNPHSWLYSGGFNYTPLDSQRTAFLFNLTSMTIQEQNLIGQGAGGSGQYQTANNSSDGPLFGGGFDIYVASNLSDGSAQNYSYGGTSFFDNIIADGGFRTNFQYGKIEVFTIANVASDVVPEPSTLVMFGLGGLGLAWSAYRKRRRAWRA
jgi:hypothetical protein